MKKRVTNKLITVLIFGVCSLHTIEQTSIVFAGEEENPLIKSHTMVIALEPESGDTVTFKECGRSITPTTTKPAHLEGMEKMLFKNGFKPKNEKQWITVFRY